MPISFTPSRVLADAARLVRAGAVAVHLCRPGGVSSTSSRSRTGRSGAHAGIRANRRSMSTWLRPPIGRNGAGRTAMAFRPRRGCSPSGPPTDPRCCGSNQTGEGFASVAVAKGRVFLIYQHHKTEAIVCWNAATGQEHWRHEYECQYHWQRLWQRPTFDRRASMASSSSPSAQPASCTA